MASVPPGTVEDVTEAIGQAEAVGDGAAIIKDGSGEDVLMLVEQYEAPDTSDVDISFEQALDALYAATAYCDERGWSDTAKDAGRLYQEVARREVLGE